MTSVHPSADVGSQVQLGEGVEIGPRCEIDGPVTLGDGVRVLGNVYLRGPLTIGANTIIYPFTCIGFPGQDVKFKPGDPTPGVVVGENCTLREHVTIHAATKPERPTTIGNRVFMMVNTHVGHDAVVGNDVIMVNNSCLAGHTVVYDKVTLSGLSAVHQFCRVGRFAFIGGGAVASCDVPPFATLSVRNIIGSINVVGMRRHGFDNAEITAIRRAYRLGFHGKSLARAPLLELLDGMAADSKAVAELAEFVRTAKRPLCRMPRKSVDSEVSMDALTAL
ncbi:MAG: acyl-ACP--UDP-N-acetylglucosamine O-acyltransferase [Leptolyngbya sp. PLA3]|nr:MAG: acyl-ACP--UDP-N-acetylglucosamine O-acyltransferase [Cyanobacteria bacterium CYA]MCE7968650.1 acyl-ACP--UDP-N-acetylglucosamine O-acyltransferase [Leptolyngbya sp. PL-A3]